MNKLVTAGLILGGGYVAYKSGVLSSFGIGTPTAPATPAPAPPDPNKIVGANTLDGVYAKMVAAGNKTDTIDGWNWVLMQVIPNFTAPDPMPLFTAATPGFDRSQLISPGQYWAVMAPWLKTNQGLSGLGRRGLGCLYEVMC